MRIEDIKIRNFRKFKNVFIDLRDDETVFIGANNSGKTSAMVAIKQFLTQCKFNIYDVTLPNHAEIKEIGAKLERETQETLEARDLSSGKRLCRRLTFHLKLATMIFTMLAIFCQRSIGLAAI